MERRESIAVNYDDLSWIDVTDIVCADEVKSAGL